MADPEFESGFSNSLPEIIPVANGLTLERLYPTIEDDQDVDALVERNRDFYQEFAAVYAEKIHSPDDAKRFLEGALLKRRCCVGAKG